MNLEYFERSSGKLEREEIYGRRALSLLYGNTVASSFFSFFFLPLTARIPFFSQLYGWLQKRRGSAKKIAPFIQAYRIDETEFRESSFASFNDFFIRKLKPECRPIEKAVDCAILPADGRYLIFPDLAHVKQFYIKGQTFDLQQFLQESAYGHRYSEGAMVIARLCPTDYHRFHFPTSGIAKKARLIEGDLFSVNPVALRKKLSILWENKRMVTEIETDLFGTLLFVEVGATCVGTIHQTYEEGPVAKGDEKGFFSFGGSCIVLLFEKGKIEFAPDLIAHTEQGFETRALFGQLIGRAVSR